MIILLVLLILIDQVSKYLVSKKLQAKPKQLGFLKLAYVKNPGAALGFMKNHKTALKLFNILVLLLVVALYYFEEISYFSFLFIVAGGIGNTLDRFTRGYVIDFFSAKKLPYFNVADIYILIGILFLLQDYLKGSTLI